MRKGFTLIEALVVIAIIGIIAAIAFPFFARSRESGHKPSCQTNLKQIGLGLAQYSQDFNEKWPPVASFGKNFGWADAVQPYIKSRQIFDCPVERFDLQDDPRQRFYTDYRYNANLSALSTEKIEHSDRTLLLTEGNDGKDNSNARYAGSTLPAAWRKDKSSPAFRHLGGANYVFTDGHVK